MPDFYFFIDDAVAEASPVLARMRLDGLDRAALPFAERHVQAWLGAPEPNMEEGLLVSVIEVRNSCLSQQDAALTTVGDNLHRLHCCRRSQCLTKSDKRQNCAFLYNRPALWYSSSRWCPKHPQTHPN